MPDLDEDRVRTWLRSAAPAYGDDAWPPPIRPIEQPLTDRLTGLGRSLDAALPADALGRVLRDSPLRSDLRSVLAQLGAARLLRLVHWLGGELADHEVTQALLADDHPEAAALRSAIDGLARQATLDRLFDRSRIEALAAAVATAKQEKD
ncbi:MAG TPA: hypothetical protein VKI44_32220 [Acetobacteraceae bacterium]|nr:hypothetical protein [Acetobacteraceae bacterium]